MQDDSAFLMQLDQDPDDLATVAVYADWLEDHGDSSRAEFLRLQRHLLSLRHRQKGFSRLSKQLLRLGRSLDPAWLAIVSLPRLAGTCWAGPNLGEEHYVWRYLPGGVLNYTCPTGTYQNGTWDQVGNHVAVEINRHYADYDGFIGGDLVRGKAGNITGLKWRWEARRTIDPVECDPGDPDTTVYDDHVRQRARRGRRHRRPAPGP
jgi:uncharacterized protein (TIGR02996 family)